MAPDGGSDLSRTDIFPSFAAANITVYTLACLLKFQEKFVVCFFLTHSVFEFSREKL
jgi:hypothetical protein